MVSSTESRCSSVLECYFASGCSIFSIFHAGSPFSGGSTCPVWCSKGLINSGTLVEGRNSCFCSPRDGRLWWRISHRFSERGRKPSLPANSRTHIEMLSTENSEEGCYSNYSREECQTQTPPHLLRAALSLSVEPAFPGLGHQHGDHLPLAERQQSAVGGSRLVGRPRPHGSSYAAVSDRLTGKTFLRGRSWRGTKTQLCPAEMGKNLKQSEEKTRERQRKKLLKWLLTCR